MRHATLWLVLLVASGLAQAKSPAESVGRLFLTPEQRARIDRGGTAASDPSNAQPGASKVDGVMMRSEGRSVLWIDGEPVLAPERAQERKARP